MSVLNIKAAEIRLLRKTLKLSEGEFADRIELEDRQAVKLLELGVMRPTANMSKHLMKLLATGAARSPKLKKIFDEIKNRSQVQW
jgi:DNA-binding transcriptional regulator YiaG